MIHFIHKFGYRFLVALLVILCVAAVGCRPPQNVSETPSESERFVRHEEPEKESEHDILNVLQAIEDVLGSVERDAQGTIIGVDLAVERASATDEVLKLALTLPNLQKFRLAGGTVSAEAFAVLKTQSGIEELFLQDMMIREEEILSVVSTLPKLKRLTLRRLSNISDAGIILLFRFPALRQLALIEMSLTGAGLQSLEDSMSLTALDVRNCAQLNPEDYRNLVRLPQLADLKIGGFAVNDQCLEIVALLPALKGLTLDDSLVSAKGFEKFVTDSLSADSLETLVLNRNMSLSDEALFAIGNFSRLKRLILGNAMVTGVFLERLAENEQKRPQFNDLALRKTFLTEEAIASLKKYPELQSLQITGGVLSKNGVETLLSLPRLGRLDLTDCSLDEDARQYLQGLELPKSLKFVN